MDDVYTPEQRLLQDAAGTRVLADTLAAVATHPELGDDAARFVAGRDFFFLSTVTADGEPTVSYKGGAPGFVRVLDSTTLAFPSYDGNGMFLSMGNIEATAKIGLLFIDFETPDRLRVQATARIVADGDPLVATFPGAESVVVATIDRVFVNCGRYIHRHQRIEASPYVPDAEGHQPLPAWKRIDGLQDVLPERDRGRVDAEGGTITAADYAERVRTARP